MVQALCPNEAIKYMTYGSIQNVEDLNSEEYKKIKSS